MKKYNKENNAKNYYQKKIGNVLFVIRSIGKLRIARNVLMVDHRYFVQKKMNHKRFVLQNHLELL